MNLRTGVQMLDSFNVPNYIEEHDMRVGRVAFVILPMLSYTFLAETSVCI